ncbi:cryptochrome-1-like isoform X2 [Plodia interpunctella]|nr:cryptochrome-1-like isoform X2 [Plodia interpunctella]XP_053601669.1 cryptochrome-1-like isoform X2 [Plodia interpunctella]XP_053601670.1 cryptochrome-1-like isoform X2 [Plodia interpunctella]XP_053601671.1 cryptochrome-1-like isoform X2 [Plodia interpunctella]XP_053601672.1 cryptochrome-1-like isoform X2 [Plodia interpunctella]
MSAAAEPLSASGARTPAPPDAGPPRTAGKHTVHWFRKGLRLHDNPALREGLNGAITFRCVFIIDPWFASSSNVGINKWRFLLQCLEDLDSSLRKLNSRLFVVRGQPADALPKLFREWGTTALTFEEDPEPYGRVRDHNIMSKCREVGITVTSRVSHTLYKLDKIIERNGGKAPLTYHQFQALIASMPPPPPAEAAITVQTLNGATTPLANDHDDRFGVPTLEELGFDIEGLKPPVWLGGESEALARLERHLERKAWVASFGRPKMTPQSLLASQTGLSPYLRFGCLSTRLFYYQLTELYKRVKQVRPPLSLHGQILWREFFYCAATRNPNFDRMEGNPICVQIPWEKNQEALVKWASGQTGFPWIDAIMIQLREEGWIHHLARHAVACFLTRGDLWISWEEGMKVFDELLLDADWSVNAGMWMWLSCSSFFQQFFHCYCPVRFGRKTDPNGDFIRRYIPALKNMPTRYIHEPWVAPDSVQQAARCIVGRDYPLPMVDHHKVSQINIERIKLVYSQLAKYKPQANLNSAQLQRPNVMQSSPSPTSIITSINQSNYLCAQTPDSQNTAPQIVQYKNTAVFQQPKHMQRIDSKQQQQFKQVVIVQQIQNSNIAPAAITNAPYVNGQHTRVDPMKPPTKQENYDFKNLAIRVNNYNQEYNNPEIYQNEESANEDYQTSVKNSNYGFMKPKFYLSPFPDNKALQNSNNDNKATFVVPGHNYTAADNDNNKKEKRDLIADGLMSADRDDKNSNAPNENQK